MMRDYQIQPWIFNLTAVSTVCFSLATTHAENKPSVDREVAASSVTAPIESLATKIVHTDFPASDLVYTSPTRLQQSRHEIPASVSRITHETIRKLQLNSLPEVFRYVAGMTHFNVDGYASSVGYHGTNIYAPPRMMLMIDGITIYRPSYGTNSWSSVPLSINDIDYIEVTRSPGAASYGINSLMAVVNIVTKSPLNSEAFSAGATTGGNHYNRFDMSFSGRPSDRVSYRISTSTVNDDGFSNNLGPRDNREIDLLNSVMNIKFNESTHASLAFYHSNGTSEDGGAGTKVNSLNNINGDTAETRSNYFSASLNHTISPDHSIILKASAANVRRSFNPVGSNPTVLLSEPLAQLSALNRDYALALINASDRNNVPRTGSPEEDMLRDQFIAETDNYNDVLFNTQTTGTTRFDSQEKNFSLELEDTYVFNDNFRLVSGFGVDRQSIDSMHLFQGEVSSTTYRLFANAETRLNDWTFNTGGMLEYNDEAGSNHAFSPRIGANYRLNNNSSLRFVYSKAVQIPDLADRALNRRIYVENMSRPYPADQRTAGYLALADVKAADNLESQEFVAREISLYTQKRYQFDEKVVDLASDFKLFHNSLSYSPYQLYDNTGTMRNATYHGIETDINVSLHGFFHDAIESAEFHISYTYLDSESDSISGAPSLLSGEDIAIADDLQATKHIGSMYSILNLRNGWFTALSYSGDVTGESEFSTYEFGVGKETKLSHGGSLTLSGKLSRQDRPDYYGVDDSATTLFLNARLVF